MQYNSCRLNKGAVYMTIELALCELIFSIGLGYAKLY